MTTIQPALTSACRLWQREIAVGAHVPTTASRIGFRAIYRMIYYVTFKTTMTTRAIFDR